MSKSNELYYRFLDLIHQDQTGQKFFEAWFRSKKPEVDPDYQKFLRLIKTDVIQNWVAGPGRTLIRNRENWAKALLPTLMERFFLPIAHRRDPTPILKFFETHFNYATTLPQYISEMRFDRTLNPELSIHDQELEYARMLCRVADELKTQQGPYWAVDTLHHIANRRGLVSGTIASRMDVNIAFATNSDREGASSFPGLRNAVIASLHLLANHERPDWSLTPSHVFSEVFHESLALVRSASPVGRQLSHDWSFLGDGVLTGGSGAMAIAVAQHLALTPDFQSQTQSQTLAPWVVISAKMELGGMAAGGNAGEVGSLREKMSAAVEEGIRVFVVASNSGLPETATPNFPDLKVLTVHSSSSNKETVAEELIRGRLGRVVWPARSDGLQPPVKSLIDHRDDLATWKAVQDIYRTHFPEEERIDLEELDSKTAILLAMMLGNEVLGYTLVSGTPEHEWMFGSYLWIKDDFRADLLVYFKNKIIAACRQKMPHVKGIIFEVDEPDGDAIRLAVETAFDDQTQFDPRSMKPSDWQQIVEVVRMVRRLNLYMKTSDQPCFMIVDEVTGVPIKYRQPAMSTINSELCAEFEVPMYLTVLFTDGTTAGNALAESGRTDAQKALTYLFDVFWPTQSVASQLCSPDVWPDYYRAMSKTLREAITKSKLVRWDLPKEMREILRKAKNRRKFDPDCFKL